MVHMYGMYGITTMEPPGTVNIYQFKHSKKTGCSTGKSIKTTKAFSGKKEFGVTNLKCKYICMHIYELTKEYI
jgi:hypothetical protein